MGILIIVFAGITALSTIGFIFEKFVGHTKDMYKDFIKQENLFDKF